MTILLDFDLYPNPVQNNRVLDIYLQLKSDLQRIDNYYKDKMKETNSFITIIMNPTKVLDIEITPSEGEIANEIRRFIMEDLSISETTKKIMTINQN